MADIAVIFPFTLTELSALSLSELIEWRERARARSGAEP
ncbi:GpE family phage tail protein [Stenotrophomonas maltophilia]|nr:GpE family phage tail protein [Stenotrophomonas maltophilia]MBN5096721.1 GpE family phage tail protein [Stenotrophomonas maltophilia]MCF3488780.1 GpE family phage tail protein [Stenotrophomonas maltophilia]